MGFVFGGYYAVLGVFSCVVHGFLKVSLIFVRVGGVLAGFADLLCFCRGPSWF